jgi:hypothetical protein
VKTAAARAEADAAFVKAIDAPRQRKHHYNVVAVRADRRTVMYSSTDRRAIDAYVEKQRVFAYAAGTKIIVESNELRVIP